MQCITTLLLSRSFPVVHGELWESQAGAEAQQVCDLSAGLAYTLSWCGSSTNMSCSGEGSIRGFFMSEF